MDFYFTSWECTSQSPFPARPGHLPAPKSRSSSGWCCLAQRQHHCASGNNGHYIPAPSTIERGRPGMHRHAHCPRPPTLIPRKKIMCVTGISCPRTRQAFVSLRDRRQGKCYREVPGKHPNPSSESGCDRNITAHLKLAGKWPKQIDRFLNLLNQIATSLDIGIVITVTRFPEPLNIVADRPRFGYYS